MSEQDEILPCVKCNKHHQQMLMLSCLHDPCIDCAAVHYVENSPKGSLFYRCSLCKEETQLDSSSVIELQRVYRTLRPVLEARESRKDDRKFQYNKSIPKPTPQSYHPQQTPTYKKQKIALPSSSMNSFGTPINYNQLSSTTQGTNPPYELGRRIVGSMVMCGQHPEDELSYFCFSCNKPICPQCAIHGSHRQHEVQTCRKAISAIKQRLNQANQSLTVEIGNLNHKKNQTREYITELTETNKRQQQMVRRQFTKLKGVVQQKEEEVLRAMSDNFQRNCEEAKYCSEMMEKIVRSYTAVRQTIDNTFKKDDITVLNQFSKREYEANDIIAQNSQAAHDSSIKNARVLDYKLFEDEISQLAGVVDSLKLTMVSPKPQY